MKYFKKEKKIATVKEPMQGKVKMGYRIYCALVAVLTLAVGTAAPAYARVIL